MSRIESDPGIGIFDRTQSVSLVELHRQVHVAIDEPRKDEFLAKIDKLTARRRIDEAARHRLDPLAFDMLCSDLGCMSGSASKTPA